MNEIKKAEWPRWLRKSFHVSEVDSLAEWADREVILPRGPNREAGPWVTARTPYNRGPMEAFLLSYVRQSVMCAATQLGKTQAHLYIPILFTIAERPRPTAIVYSSGEEDKNVSETRLQPLIKECPATAEQIPQDKDLFKKKRMIFPGMTLFVLSAGTLSETKQKQICNLFLDEIEAYPGFGGKAAAEGDVVSAYEERCKGYWPVRKVFMSSSRVFVGGTLDKRLAMSQVVFKWHVKCPFCDEWLSLSRDMFYYEDLGEGHLDRIKKARETAYFLCDSCGNHITDKERPILNERGDWLPGYIQVDVPKQENDPQDNEEPDKYVWRPMPDIDLDDYIKKGSYIWLEYCKKHKPSSIGWTDLYTSYSPWVQFADIAEKAISVSGDFEKEKVFLKDWWCEVAKPKVKAHRATELLDLIDKDREEGIVPIDAVALVAGIDNQNNRVYAVVLAVNRMEYNKEKVWLIWYREIPKTGHTDYEATDYSGVSDFLNMKFKREGASVATIPIWRCAMDTGGGREHGSNDSLTQESYKFLEAHSNKLPGGVWGIKGSSFPMQTPIKPGKVKINDIYPIQFVDTSYFSHFISDLIKNKRFRLHKDTDRNFMNHLTGEVFVQNDKGKWSWQKKANSRRIDYRDATKYALAMLEEIQGQSIKNVSLAAQRNINFSQKEKKGNDRPKNYKKAFKNQRSSISTKLNRLRSRLR